MFRLVHYMNYMRSIPSSSTISWLYLGNSTRCYGIPKKNKLPPRPLWLIKDDEIEEKFIKGGQGPGGQKINKSNSKVQLKHLPTGIVVTNQSSRSQELNRKRARAILAEKIQDLADPETSRLAIINQRKIKVKHNKSRKASKKYKKLQQLNDEESPTEPLEMINIEEEFFQQVK